MTRRLLATYLSITAFALAALAVPLGLTFSRGERDRLWFDLERDAGAVASLAEDALEAGTDPPVDAVLADYRRRTDGRIVVVDRRGVTVADSDAPDAEPRDFSTRPEVAAALDGRRSVGTRPSATLGSDLVYVAIPAASGGTVHGAVRVTFPTASLDARVRAAWLRLAGLSFVVLAAVAGVGLVLARSVTRPVRVLEEAAARIAGGDLGARAAVDRGPPEVRHLATTFDRTAERLDQLVGAQRRFVADAAHQLRTPLTALRLRLENLEPHLAAGGRPTLDAAVEEVRRLGRIVDGLLVLARTDAGHQVVGPVDVAAAACDRVDAWREAAEAAGVEVVAYLPESLWAEATEGAVEQILDNLLSNAVAASPPGTVVTVSAAATPDGCVLSVADQGPGMSEDERVRAFDRFWRGRAGGPGTGLGLAIVRELARRGGGDAWLGPSPGGSGVEASVGLPAAPGPRTVQGPRPAHGAEALTER